MSLPEFYTTPEDMAKCLVGYIACPKRIRHEILSTYQQSPSISQIEEIRGMRQRKMARETEPYHPHEGYYPGDASKAAEAVNQRFVKALAQERG